MVYAKTVHNLCDTVWRQRDYRGVATEMTRRIDRPSDPPHDKRISGIGTGTTRSGTAFPLAVVTGASSGLGAALARRLHRAGYALILTGRREAALEDVRRTLADNPPRSDESAYGGEGPRRATPPSPRILVADLRTEGGRRALGDLLDLLAETAAVPALLVNCAGVGDFGPFIQASPDRAMAQIETNVFATTMVTRDIAERMVRSGAGVICTIASVAGFFPGPLMAVYYATKAYQVSLSQALDAELKPRGVRSVVVCPGPFRSPFHDTAGIDSRELYRKLLLPDADDIARFTLRAINRRRSVAVPGAGFRLFVFIQRFLPRRLVTTLVYNQQKRRIRVSDRQP